jgi:Transglycosylase SLT domain
MRTAILIGALMALVLGSSNAHAKGACPPGSSAATKRCRLDQRGDLCQQKGICGTEAIGDHLVGESLSKFSPEVAEAIKEGSALVGVDPEMMAKLAYSKSRGNPNAVVGNRKGLMLLTEEEMRLVSSGEGNVFNPRDSVMAAATIMKQKTASAPKRLRDGGNR